jgi:hypothetical protein
VSHLHYLRTHFRSVFTHHGRLFRSPVFAISAVQFLLATRVLFVAMPLSQEMIQVAEGKAEAPEY